MNEFDFHYMHHARSEELLRDAENERLARSLLKAAKDTRRGAGRVRHDGVARRVARALGRGEAGRGGSGRRNEQATAS
ncbi:hypothetical protein [Glycomyces paridis]|uniref:Uncharacterized protein n=1 Tax=Glycomyces paridis TaxID=2126555 RepID=A0A4S8PA03_9ACTN|nr:hypothetical protein [Glycomyces paridis]THV27100.1 hypothetical protein E9998_16675 [Glycomyces paridis]